MMRKQISSNSFPSWRRLLAVTMCCFCPGSFLAAQDVSIDPVRAQAPILWRPYVPVTVPSVRLKNSTRLNDLLRAGRLYLTAQDAVELALENNIDIEIARYNPISLGWSLERAQAGGALPGVPSGATQASSNASGQGVLGSQAAAGVTAPGNGATKTNTANATVTQIGPVTQTLDPTFQDSTIFSHRTIPFPDIVQSGTPILVQNQRVYSASLQQGFLTGGSATLSYTNHYLNENAPSDLLNPSVDATLNLSVQQNFLQGFGHAVNARTITVSQINLKNADLNFKSQIIATVVNVLNTYYALVADYEDQTAKSSAVDVARTFVQNSREQVQIGTLAEIDVVTAESQLATAEQDLVNSRGSLQKDEATLKSLISRTGGFDPLIGSAQIIPLDRLVIPASDNLPPLKTLIEETAANRSDLVAEKVAIQTAEVSRLGTSNAVLPTLVGFASTFNTGLAGTGHTIAFEGISAQPNPYFVGNIGNALGQIFRRNFPSESGGAFFSATLRNRAAQADNGIDQLSIRQQELENAKDLKQAQVDVLNAIVAMRQSRARYDAAAHNRVLQKSLADAEQEKFRLGTSIPYNVITTQRDLTAAQSTEIAALVSYTNAKITLDQTTGTILSSYHISLPEVSSSQVGHKATLPATMPQAPQTN